MWLLSVDTCKPVRSSRHACAGLAGVLRLPAASPEGGGGGRQTLGLLLLFASYLGVYTVSGMALTGIAGAALGGIVFPVLIASIAMPLLTRVMFKLVGVSVSRAD